MITTSKPNSLMAYAILIGFIVCVYSLFAPVLENMRALKNKRSAMQQDIVALDKLNSEQDLAVQKVIEDLNSLSRDGFLHPRSEESIQVEAIHGFIKDHLKALQGRVLQFQTTRDELNLFFAEGHVDISFVLPIENFASFISGFGPAKIPGTIESLMISKTSGGGKSLINGHLRLKVLSVNTASIPAELDFDSNKSEPLAERKNSTELSGLLNRKVRQAIRSKNLEHLGLLGITLSNQTGSALFRDSATNKTIKIDSGEYYLDWKLVQLTAESASLKHSSSNSIIQFDIRKD